MDSLHYDYSALHNAHIFEMELEDHLLLYLLPSTVDDDIEHVAARLRTASDKTDLLAELGYVLKPLIQL